MTRLLGTLAFVDKNLFVTRSSAYFCDKYKIAFD